MSVRFAAAMVATALASCAAALPALAQPADQETAQAAVHAFNIPPQPLAEALIAFGRQAGLQVSVESAVIRGITTPGVSGTMTRDQALTALLAGTGLVYRINGSMVALERPPAAGSGAMQLDPLQVQGFAVPSQAMIDNIPAPYAGGQVATGGQLGLLGNRGVMDTPFNQTSYTAKKAQDQQARSVRDVLIDDPSIRFTTSDNGNGNASMSIRGFVITPTTSVSYGGLYGILPFNTTMMELAERVEVLKGPSVMLNGMPPGGTVGGTVNVVAKRAPAEDLTQFTANYISAGQFGGHVDFARRFGEDKQFGVRFNGVFRAGQTDVQYNTDQDALATLGLDFRGERVRLSADFGYQYQYFGGLMPALGVANGVQLPWAPNVRNNPGAQPWNYKEVKDVFGVVRGEVDLTERVTAYAAFGAHDYRFGGLYSSQVVASNFNGTATSSAPQNTSQYFSVLTAEAGLRALVDTGPIGHEFAFTATTFSNQIGAASALGTAFATNFYNPTLIARPNIATPVANKVSTSTLSSLGFADTLSGADKRLQLTVGARLQQVQSTNFNATTGAATASYDQSALSPSVALIFKPWENVSIYGNFIQGLQQGAVVGSTFANAGEVFPPYKSTQYEAGIKVDWGKLTTTASIFQISVPSILTNTLNNTQVLGGEQRNQGLELNVFGEIAEGVRVVGGAMFLSPVLTKTQGGATDGWIAPFSPTAQFNLAGEWDMPFLPALTLTGRFIYTGSQFIDTTLPRRQLPEWTRLDVGVRYAFENPGAKGKLLVARFNIDNLLDANYWQSGLGASNLFLGAPRTFRVALTADF